MVRTSWSGTLLVPLLVFSAACTVSQSADSDASSTAVTLAEADLTPEHPPPAPGQPDLRLVGEVLTVNDGTGLSLDVATIDDLRHVEIETYEPFDERTVTFSGVWLEDLLRFAGAPADASVHLRALDDYEVTFGAQEIADGALLATRQGGQRMSISDGGPTRIVFADESTIGENSSLWIWSVDVITVGAG